MSAIYINDIVVSGKHGANPGEKDVAQPFKVCVTLEFDMSKPAASDDLEDTLDWSALRDSIVATVEETSFNLVERLAAEIADRLLVDGRVDSVKVRIDKLEAFENGTPGVQFERNND